MAARSFLALVITVFLLSEASIVFGQGVLQYSINEPGITTLDTVNFTQLIDAKSNAFVVTFYKNWCPHCKRFAPLWKTVALDLIDWQPVVKLAVIDCALQHNAKTCRDHGVRRVPHLAYFPPNWKSSASQLPFHMEKQEDIKYLRERIVDQVTNSSINGSAPKSWPMMKFCSPDKYSALTPFTTSHRIFGIPENATSYLGREVILDLSKYQDKVIVRRVALNGPCLTHLKSIQAPGILTWHRSLRNWIVFKAPSDIGPKARQSIVEIIKEESGIKDRNKSTTPAPTTAKPVSIPPSNEVYMADMYLGLRQILTTEIHLYEVLEGNNLLVFKRFLSLVQRYFPYGNRQETRNFLDGLSAFLAAETTINSSSLANQVNRLEKKHRIPQPKDWMTCRGSDPSYRGYTCSVWLLFHTMTVNEYLSVGKDQPIQHEVTRSMKEFIRTFFSCEECRKNFIKESADLESHLKSKESSILWLWRTHNSVNQRLAGDPTEDPSYPKIQFPPASICPKCWSGKAFNEAEIVKYLLKRYQTSSWIPLKG